MGHCQKIKTERVLADQIFMVTDTFPQQTCPLEFYVAEGDAIISGTLLVTVTNCKFVLPVLPADPLQVELTLMYQKELCVAPSPTDPPTFVPPMTAPFALEFKFEEVYTLNFCLTWSDLADLGVDPEDVDCQLVRIVDVNDSFPWNCGSPPDGETPAIPASITQEVTTSVKIKLVTEDQVVVALCPAKNSKIVRIPRTTCPS
jgi:hypothetical protein